MEKEEFLYKDYFNDALNQTNCVISGTTSHHKIKRRSCSSSVAMELQNCFIKLSRTGRDIYFNRLFIEVHNVHKTQIPLAPEEKEEE